MLSVETQKGGMSVISSLTEDRPQGAAGCRLLSVVHAFSPLERGCGQNSPTIFIVGDNLVAKAV